MSSTDPKRTVLELSREFNAARDHLFDVVNPAVERIGLLGRYRVGKLGEINGGLLFGHVIAPAGETVANFVPAAITAMLRFSPDMKDATAEQFATKMRQLRESSKVVAEETKLLYGNLEGFLVNQYPDRVRLVGMFRKTVALHPDDVFDLQIEVAQEAGLQLPPAKRRDTWAHEDAAQSLLNAERVRVRTTQTNLAARMMEVLDDGMAAAELQRGFSDRGIAWSPPAELLARALVIEGSVGDTPNTGNGLGQNNTISGIGSAI